MAQSVRRRRARADCSLWGLDFNSDAIVDRNRSPTAGGQRQRVRERPDRAHTTKRKRCLTTGVAEKCLKLVTGEGESQSSSEQGRTCRTVLVWHYIDASRDCAKKVLLAPCSSTSRSDSVSCAGLMSCACCTPVSPSQ